MEKQKLNTTLIYVLSIFGFLCCCLAGLGLIPSGIALFLSNKQLKEAYADPENYENIEAMKTAKTVALVSLIINGLFILLVLYRIYEVGGFEAFIEIIKEAFEEAKRNSQ